MRDPALDVLFRPWDLNPPRFDASERVIFHGVRPHPGLAMAAPAQVEVVQRWQPDAGALRSAGFALASDDSDLSPGASAALILAGKHRDANLAAMARLALALEDGGQFVLSAPKRSGAGRYERAAAELFGDVEVQSKHHCRIVEAHRGPSFNRELAASWAELDTPRQVVGGWWSRPGVFGWAKEDRGTRLLLDTLPARVGEAVADLGCGIGWISRALLERGVEVLHAVEADARALALCRRNLDGHTGSLAIHEGGSGELRGAPGVYLHWADATGVLPFGALDAVVTNPPFHDGSITDVEVGRAFLRAAVQALRPGGRLWAVANRKLPYEHALYELADKVEVAVEADGFKVLTAVRRSR